MYRIYPVLYYHKLSILSAHVTGPSSCSLEDRRPVPGPLRAVRSRAVPWPPRSAVSDRPRGAWRKAGPARRPTGRPAPRLAGPTEWQADWSVWLGGAATEADSDRAPPSETSLDPSAAVAPPARPPGLLCTRYLTRRQQRRWRAEDRYSRHPCSQRRKRP